MGELETISKLELILKRVVEEPPLDDPDEVDFEAKDLEQEIKDRCRGAAKYAIDDNVEIFTLRLRAGLTYEQRQDFTNAGYSFDRASNACRILDDTDMRLHLLKFAERNLRQTDKNLDLAFVHLKMAECFADLRKAITAKKMFETAYQEFRQVGYQIEENKMFSTIQARVNGLQGRGVRKYNRAIGLNSARD